MKVLNGISIAVVVALVPQALLGELLKALVPSYPSLQQFLALIALSASMLPAIIGFLVGMQFKLNPIQNATVAVAAVLGSGVAKVDPDGGFHLQGTGLVINAGVTAAIAVLLAKYIGPKLGQYIVLFLPMIVVVVAGGIGWLVTYPVVNVFSRWLGQVIVGATDLQPILMGAIMAMVFAFLILSPISTVGIATAIFLAGVASGTANLGCVCASFGVCVAGWRANPVAASLLPVIGSPKVHMANIMGRPLNFLPILCTSAIVGAIGGWLGISGTPISAGFGISGLVGPVTALNAEGWGWTFGNVLIIIGIFIVVPLLLSIVFVRLFERAGIIRPDHYRLDFV
ncbi:PTS transporter subunit IIC [Corynebacterium gerontici]|nr:PTS sugar transporter subunit IIC [Corynebacterium gerontici]